MMKTTHTPIYVLCLISVLVLCLSVAGPGMAQVSKKISYQGYLQDSLTGTPITGTVQMEFALYDVPIGGSPLWSEAQQVEVNAGRYSVHLGAVTPLNLTEVKPYYLGIKLDGEMLTDDNGVEYREELTSGLYSLFSGATGGSDFPILLWPEWPDPRFIPENTFYGASAGENITTGRQNTFIGHEAGLWNTEGSSNTFVGDDAGRANESGSYNTFVGHDAGRANNRDANTFVGYRAGWMNTNGSSNTFLGHNAGLKNTDGYKNTFVGDEAGQENKNGFYNTFIGDEAGWKNTSGTRNTFVGNLTGRENMTGDVNTFVGFGAGSSNTSGSTNTFLGGSAGASNEDGSANTFVGHNAGMLNTEGSRNVFLGNAAGQNESGSDKLYIHNSSSDTPLIYGDFATGFVIINGSLFYTGLLSRISDQRLKNIQRPFTSGLEAIEQLQPVSYRYKAKNPLNLSPDKDYVGVVAQEVQTVIPEAVEEGENGYLMVNNDPIIWTMLNAIKELNTQNEALKAQNEMMMKEIELLKKARFNKE